ncbi:hypothetical protein [Halorussus caseinilyticus]|uniref:hypothetical protein n=1 Tax=Halorussus caseinilyticus TaxID=3034025 RepID=UPI0023E8E52B|nr:hypothetical protein [Halorussus sp. DT72]
MPKDTPQPEKTVRERGTFASHNDNPTLASYLSSLFLVLSVPGFIVAAYAGHSVGLYGYDAIVPAFAGLLVGSLAVAFALMHWLTGN